MIETAFDPGAALIVVAGKIRGPRGAEALVRLVLDTGAAVTTIAPQILHEVGYSARQGVAVSRVRSPIGIERGYLIQVDEMEVLGHPVRGLVVNALDVDDAEEPELDGLLGLDFLRRFNCELRFGDAVIRLEPIART